MKDAFKARLKAYDAMFNMFQDNYISELRTFRDQKLKPTDQCLQVGMVVLFKIRGLFKKDAAGDRRKWRPAKIVKLHPSPTDGRVRSVDIEVYDLALGRMRVYDNQSIAHLALLEAEDTDGPQWLQQRAK
jgi:hypothetical protein